jgi:hypothetical protein
MQSNNDRRLRETKAGVFAYSRRYHRDRRCFMFKASAKLLALLSVVFSIAVSQVLAVAPSGEESGSISAATR